MTASEPKGPFAERRPVGDPYVCATCAAHYPDGPKPPERCAICTDERQYVGVGGQRWARLSEVTADHEMRFTEYEAGLWGVGLKPGFAIGQRALLVRTDAGNVLWDCVPVLTDAGYQRLQELGGISAIAVSHPHFYTGLALYAEAFGANVYLHTADKQHVTHPHPRVNFWEGETLEPLAGVTLIRAGGHFAGGTVLHWAAGADGAGALLTGDIIGVVPDRRYVSFMYSFPNYLPLPPREVERVGAAVEPYEFARIYGGWKGNVIASGAKDAVRRSVVRYRQAVEARLDGAVLPWPEPPAS